VADVLCAVNSGNWYLWSSFRWLCTGRPRDNHMMSQSGTEWFQRHCAQFSGMHQIFWFHWAGGNFAAVPQVNAYCRAVLFPCFPPSVDPCSAVDLYFRTARSMVYSYISMLTTPRFTASVVRLILHSYRTSLSAYVDDVGWWMQSNQLHL